jgi:hypothetical protein
MRDLDQSDYERDGENSAERDRVLTKGELNQLYRGSERAQDNELVIIWAQSVTNPDAVLGPDEPSSHYLSQQVFRLEFDKMEDVQRVLHYAMTMTIEGNKLIPES